MNSFCCLRLEKTEKINQLKLPSSKITKNTFLNKAPIIIQDINMDTVSSKKSRKKASNNKNKKYKKKVNNNFHHLNNVNLKVDKSIPSNISDINFINDNKVYKKTSRNIKRERNNDFVYNIKNYLPISTPIKEGSFFGDEQLTSVSFLESNLSNCESEIMNKIECHTNSKIINYEISKLYNSIKKNKNFKLNSKIKDKEKIKEIINESISSIKEFQKITSNKKRNNTISEKEIFPKKKIIHINNSKYYKVLRLARPFYANKILEKIKLNKENSIDKNENMIYHSLNFISNSHRYCKNNKLLHKINKRGLNNTASKTNNKIKKKYISKMKLLDLIVYNKNNTSQKLINNINYKESTPLKANKIIKINYSASPKITKQYFHYNNPIKIPRISSAIKAKINNRKIKNKIKSIKEVNNPFKNNDDNFSRKSLKKSFYKKINKVLKINLDKTKISKYCEK
jgi:hypothetical protein